MISIDDVVRVIRERFETEVATKLPDTIPVLYDNVDVDTVPEEGTTWIRWSVKPTTYRQADFGSNPRFRNFGVATASIYIPVNQGDAEAYEIAHRIRAAFRSVGDRWVRFKYPAVRKLGRIGRFHQVLVDCPFDADEILGYPFTLGFSGGFEAYG